MYDLILRGGTVVDGTRSRPYAADVCIRDGRIARIAPDAGEEAREVVDVSGLTVAPGFIDIHSHSDACPLLSFQPESKLFQGITTEITCNCGTSILPSLPENSREIVQYFFDDTSMFSQVVLNEKDRSLDGLYGVEEYARAVAAHGCTANYGQLVGHGTLRVSSRMFRREMEATEQEIADMRLAWRIVKHTKSNGIAIAKDGQSLGIGPGQTNRIWPTEMAIARSGERVKGAALGSDAFFPFGDNVERARKSGVEYIVQPGGSIRDDNVIETANKYGITMAFTGMRLFHH